MKYEYTLQEKMVIYACKILKKKLWTKPKPQRIAKIEVGLTPHGECATINHISDRITLFVPNVTDENIIEMVNMKTGVKRIANIADLTAIELCHEYIHKALRDFIDFKTSLMLDNLNQTDMEDYLFDDIYRKI